MQKHVLSCLKWTELRRDLNMNRINDLVTFLKRLLEEKEKMEPERLYPWLGCGTDDEFSS